MLILCTVFRVSIYVIIINADTLFISILNVTSDLMFHHLNDVVLFVSPSGGSPSSVMLN